MLRALACAALLLTPTLHATHATCGRIDIYVHGKAFDLNQVSASTGARAGHCSWLGKGKERTGASSEVQLPPTAAWTPLWIEFVPAADGLVDIDLQGEHYRKLTGNDVRLVWADNVSVEGEGASIVNGDFEEAGPDGKPVGWKFTSALQPDRYSRDGKVATSGESCVAVWYGSQARQAFTVRRGKRYRVTAWFRLIEPDAARAEALARAKAIAPRFEFYQQTIEIAFADAAAAARATVKALPLYDGREWAISSRWDDNNLSDLKMRQVLEEHGYRGNFYLTGTDRGFHGNPYGLTKSRSGTNIDKQLLPGGNAIGGHSWTHPMLSYCNRNRIFEEITRVRVDREASSDSPVCSYAFSFCNMRNSLEGPDVHLDIAEALARAGYHHVANARFLQGTGLSLPVSWLLPLDGKPIDAAFGRLLRDPYAQGTNPNISFDMHVWYRTPEAWRKFEAQLDKYGRNPKWWYCNQNEYGAYRHQYLLTEVTAQLRGKKLRVTLRRPCLRDLNDPVPLAFEVAGANAGQVGQIDASGARCERTQGTDGNARFHLGHAPGQALPDKIAWLRNPVNGADPAAADPDHAYLAGLLRYEDDRLSLSMRNAGDEPLRNVRITYRLPLAWQHGVVSRKLEAVPRGEHRDTLLLEPAHKDYKYRSDTAFYVAQVDFDRSGRAGRVYFTCRVPVDQIDASYPQHGFTLLGPIPADEFQVGRADALSRNGGDWTLKDGKTLTWSRAAPKVGAHLDVEVVRTSGSWRHNGEANLYYLLRSSVESPVEQQILLRFSPSTVNAAFVNGERVKQQSAVLRKGSNRLLLVCLGSGTYRPGNAGAFLRLTAPDGRRRVADVAFSPE